MVHSEFPHLFSPGRVGPLDLKNRIVALPHGTHMAQAGLPTRVDLDHHVRLARGGVGLIVCGGTITHATSALRSRRLVEAFLEDAIPGLAERVTAVHQHGARIVGQLFHLGRELIGGEMDGAPVAPSAIRSPRDPYPPHELSADEIEEQVDAFVKSAMNLETAGFDGVEVHAAHGYLVAQFLSPATNTRTDAFGGSAADRFLFLRLIVERIRASCSPGFVLGVRLSAEEEVPGGLTLGDSCEIAGRLAELGGVDYLSVTHGTRGSYVKDSSQPDGVAVQSAAQVKAASGLPTIVAQRIRDPHQAEEILRAGAADLVGMTRALLADPQLPQKAFEGRTLEIRGCLGINQDCRSLDPHLRCAVNAEIGKPSGPASVPRVERAKVVYVVGGGPAGLEAARVAASRGHRVTLFEGQRELGGQALIAAAAPHRASFADIVDFQRRELQRLKVEIHLGAEIGPGDLRLMAAEADSIVIATGSRPAREMTERRADVLTVDDVLSAGGAISGRSAVVVDERDGFWPAYSAAERLAMAGMAVVVVTPAPAAAARLPHESVGPLFKRFDDQGVRLLAHHDVISIEPDAVTVAPLVSGTPVRLPADVLVWHGGRSVNDDLSRVNFESPTRAVVDAIGDCVTPRRLSHAIAEGHQLGLSL
jgi:2,4-dienoyl-CoA reductase (NADPH2)